MGLGTEPQNIIYQGEDKILTFNLIQRFNNGEREPYDLTSATEILAIFPTSLTCQPGTTNPTTPPITKRLTANQISILTAGAGKFTVTLTGADSLQFPATPSLPLYFRIVKNGLTRYTELKGAIAVLSDPYKTIQTIVAGP